RSSGRAWPTGSRRGSLSLEASRVRLCGAGPPRRGSVAAPDTRGCESACGRSLLPLMNFRLAAPSLLVDLRRIRGLERLDAVDGVVRIGAMVRQRDAEERPETAAVPLLREALRHVAHPQIRSRGTIGGSVAHADPAAELPAVLVALD